MSHSTQAGAVPVDLAGLRVEGGFLAGLLFELLGRLHGALAEGELLCWGLFGIGLGGGGFPFFADPGLDGVEGGEGFFGGVFLKLVVEGDWGCC